MSKKDYEVITNAFNGHMTHYREVPGADSLAQTNTLISLANRLASDFAKTNPRFNRATFLRACGVEVSS